jgi:ATP-binding cassette subfamily C protein CydD
VLRDIEFELKAGEHIALVGASGVGKTTLLNLFMAFIAPTSGQIRFNGISLDTLDREDLRRKMAWIGQRPVLFHGTVRENIRFGRPEATEDELEEAARAARVIEFCRHLPDGLDTLVGEQGIGLSRGQAQRVALARAFLKNAPLLLLDEPTAGLDTENEHLILAALEILARDRTVLMATHRLGNLHRADRIIILAEGRILEQGSYAQLTASGSAFQRLVSRREGEADNG